MPSLFPFEGEKRKSINLACHGHKDSRGKMAKTENLLQETVGFRVACSKGSKVELGVLLMIEIYYLIQCTCP